MNPQETKQKKKELAKSILELVEADLAKSRLKTEVQSLSDIAFIVKVWPEEGDFHFPAYFQVKVSEIQ